MKKGLFAIIIFTLLFSQKGSSQWYHTTNMGARLGIVVALGTHIDRIGICANGYYFDNWFQGNAEVRAYYNFRNLGPRKKQLELVCALGFALGYGGTDTTYNRFYSSISNQTKYKNSFAYSYNFYLNRIKTTQVTGIIALQFQGFSLLLENDIFAKQMLDRFRTGAVMAQYQYNEFQFGVNTTLWTGELGRVVKDNPKFPYGYVDTTNGVHTKYSHGLLSIQCKTTLPYYQYAQANIGFDSEKIRDLIQNKMVHNVFRSTNSDLPMLDTNGDQYLYKDGQKIRRTKVYFNAYMNPGIFY